MASAESDSGIGLDELERRCRAALKDDPGHAPSLDLLCDVLVRTGRPRDCLIVGERWLARHPGTARAHLRLGEAMAVLDRPQEALFRFSQAASLDPSLADAHAEAGGVLAALGRSEEAMASFEKALALEPDCRTAHLGAGTLLARQARHEDAIAHFAVVLQQHPAQPDALYGMGNSLFALFRAADALQAYDKLRAAQPRSVTGHLGAGNALQALGRLDEARTAYESALALAPGVPTLHRAIAEIKRFRPGDPQLAAMEELARRADRLPDPERISLHFALAKAYDDLARHEEAFAHLRQGNALKRRSVHYDEAATLGLLRDMEAAFPAGLMGTREGQGDPSDVPVFIVGMPRSGTTLVEQILAAHPRFFAAGEQRHLQDALEECGATPRRAASLSSDDWRRLGSAYLRRVPAGFDRVTDKLPANFRNLGFIRLALPNARIIHVRRDAMDTCFSCFSRLFVDGLEYTNDLGELGRYCRAYERLMEHWRRVLPPGAMLEVQYEELVADFGSQARRIVAYCGLDWDERCLKFHEAERAIYTVSVQQVRRPLFSTSVGRWRAYEKHLRPLRDALEGPAR